MHFCVNTSVRVNIVTNMLADVFFSSKISNNEIGMTMENYQDFFSCETQKQNFDFAQYEIQNSTQTRNFDFDVGS